MPLILKKLFPQNLKNIYHLSRAILANVYFGFPSRKIKVIGVTGTNGKTTTTQMIAKILEKAGYQVAVSSTINYKIGQQEWVNDTKYTTPAAWDLQKFIHRAVKAGCHYLVLETASHSLDQHRVWGVVFDAAVITNVTREHLDYHQTMEQYRQAKTKLFKLLFITRRKPNTPKVAVVNLDMERPEEFLSFKADEKYGYSMKSEDVKNNVQSDKDNFQVISASNIDLGLDGTTFQVGQQWFSLNLIGQFNVENALAAISVGISQKVDLALMAEALGEIKKVPGRMDEVENDLGIRIVIDYAVTPDSMEKLGQLIKTIKPTDKKLLWVFGSCGERDRGKRPIMGRIVAGYADLTIVTNEDPYNENPQQIIDEVFRGVCEIKKEGVDCWQIMDRKEAIKKAIELAQSGDIILVTGKGAEEVMLVGSQRIRWNDRNVIEQLLKQV